MASPSYSPLMEAVESDLEGQEACGCYIHGTTMSLEADIMTRIGTTVSLGTLEAVVIRSKDGEREERLEEGDFTGERECVIWGADLGVGTNGMRILTVHVAPEYFE